MTSWLFALEITANKSSGNPIPNPKTIKFKKFVKKSVAVVLMANNIIKDAGLQGNTMAPKKKPNMNDVKYGFFVIGK